MTILDRYITRQYLTNVAILLVILFCFVVAVDVSLNLNRYWSAALDMSKEGDRTPGGLRALLLTVHMVADLWWPRLLQLYSYLIGVVMVGAMGFTVAQMVRHRELIAVLMSGQSLTRIARPIIFSAALLQALSLLNQEYIIANERVATLLTRDAGDAGKRELGVKSVNLTRDAANRVFHASAFDADKGVVQGLTVWERTPEGQVTHRIEADRAIWQSGEWALENGLRWPLKAGAEPETVTSLQTDLDPTLLKVREFEGYGQKLSSAQISEMVRRLDRIGSNSQHAEQTRRSLERIRWGRWSMALSGMLSLIISMPFFLTREPRNMLLQSLKSAPISIIALVGGVLGASAEIPRFPSWLSAMVPVAILTPIAIALFDRMRLKS